MQNLKELAKIAENRGFLTRISRNNKALWVRWDNQPHASLCFWLRYGWKNGKKTPVKIEAILCKAGHLDQDVKVESFLIACESLK